MKKIEENFFIILQCFTFTQPIAILINIHYDW